MISYEQDEDAWRQEMINLLEEGKLSEIDSVNLQVMLIEMGVRERAEVENRLVLLVMHILKASYQPDRATRSWFLTIREQRKQLNRILNKSENLTKHAKTFWPQAYQESRVDAHYETELPLSVFPETPPMTIDKVLDNSWFPESLRQFA